jgi:arginyl-tRNA synthetase
MLTKDLRDYIKDALGTCLKSLQKEFPSVKDIPVHLEIPKERAHGDTSTNLALQLGKHLKKNPQVIAQDMKEKLHDILNRKHLADYIEKIEVKPPGFINMWYGKRYLYEVLEKIEQEGNRFGWCDIGHGKKLQIEFVSANPTGPLTIAHGRQAAVGDTLARILTLANFNVSKEYYVNDEGTQITLLGESLRARYLEALGEQIPFPERGYKGAYLTDIAAEIRQKHKDRHRDAKIQFFIDFGIRHILEAIKHDLGDFGVHFDLWYAQSSLTKSGKLKKALALLERDGHLYHKDGALWFRSEELGDDKDRVVIKSDGSFTYLAPDIAYHYDKFKRHFNKVINIWGPDHHGYIKRLIAAVKALGHNPEDVSILLVQLATLYRGGEVVPMSTREGQFVTLREVIDEVGKDAARFFFLMRKTDSHLDFDLELAKQTSFDNPVYYIQYAHARAASILKFAKEQGLHDSRRKTDPALLTSDEAIAILKLLRRFSQVIAMSAQSLEPYVLLSYLLELTAVFHSYYTKHRVVTDDASLSYARLKLVRCTKHVLAHGLSLLGITAPEQM